MASAAARAFLSGAAKASPVSYVEKRVLRTSPMHLLNIISDVDSYSQFLPQCTHSQILRRSNCGTMFDATLTVGLPPLLSEEYVSRVKVDTEAMTVEARSIRSSLFDSLKSRWKLRPVLASREQQKESRRGVNSLSDATSSCLNSKTEHDEYCDVEFEVEIKASNPLIVGTLDKVLEEVAGKQVAAFEKRCLQISPSKGAKR
jgi:ribosome-associated toxin RatA of RatAB toxin-antitoxin module